MQRFIGFDLLEELVDGGELPSSDELRLVPGTWWPTFLEGIRCRKWVVVYLYLLGDGLVFQDHEAVAAVGVVEELEKCDRKDVVILLVGKSDVTVGLGVAVLYSIPFYLLNQVGVVHDAWHRPRSVREAPPLAHPVEGDDEVAVRAGHVWVVVKRNTRAVLAALMVLIHVVLVELLLGIASSLDRPALRNLFCRYEQERLDCSLLSLYVSLPATSLRGHGVGIGVLEIGALIRSQWSRRAVLQFLLAGGTRSENAVAAVSVDLVFAHVLEVFDYLMLLVLAVSTQVLLPILLGHADVLLLQSTILSTTALLYTLAIAIVVLNTVTVRRNDLDFNLVRLRKAKALGEQAAASLLLDRPLLISLQCFVGMAVRRTQLTVISFSCQLVHSGRACTVIIAGGIVDGRLSVAGAGGPVLTGRQRSGRALLTFFLLVLG